MQERISVQKFSKAGTTTTNRGASRNLRKEFRKKRRNSVQKLQLSWQSNLGKEFRKKETKSSSNIVAKLVKNQHTQAKRRLSRAKGEK